MCTDNLFASTTCRGGEVYRGAEHLPETWAATGGGWGMCYVGHKILVSLFMAILVDFNLGF